MIRNNAFFGTDSTGKELYDSEFPLFHVLANSGDIRLYPAGYLPSHWHRELELFYLLCGDVEIVISGQSYRVTAGEGCFINTGILHSFQALSDAPCLYHSFVFDAGIVSGMPGSVFDALYVHPLLEKGPAYYPFSAADSTDFREPFDRAFLACEREDPGYEFTVRAAFSEILLALWKRSRLLPARNKTTVSEERLKRMLTWMHKNIAAAVTIRDIAAAANVCPRECQRIFMQYLHYSPMAYLQRRRIFHAAELLCATGQSITEIALDCGFQSPSYFSSQFRSLIGSTPTEYRQRYTSITPASDSTPTEYR